jgi:hypothetical protein
MGRNDAHKDKLKKPIPMADTAAEIPPSIRARILSFQHRRCGIFVETDGKNLRAP